MRTMAVITRTAISRTSRFMVLWPPGRLTGRLVLRSVVENGSPRDLTSTTLRRNGSQGEASAAPPRARGGGHGGGLGSGRGLRASSHGRPQCPREEAPCVYDLYDDPGAPRQQGAAHASARGQDRLLQPRVLPRGLRRPQGAGRGRLPGRAVR